MGNAIAKLGYILLIPNNCIGPWSDLTILLCFADTELLNNDLKIKVISVCDIGKKDTFLLGLIISRIHKVHIC